MTDILHVRPMGRPGKGFTLSAKAAFEASFWLSCGYKLDVWRFTPDNLEPQFHRTIFPKNRQHDNNP